MAKIGKLPVQFMYALRVSVLAMRARTGPDAVDLFAGAVKPKILGRVARQNVQQNRPQETRVSLNSDNLVNEAKSRPPKRSLGVVRRSASAPPLRIGKLACRVPFRDQES